MTVTSRQLAKRSGFTDRWIRQLCAAGQIRAEKPGHDWLIADEEAERWLRGRKEKWVDTTPKYKVYRADGTEVDCPCMVFLATDVFAAAAITEYRNLVQRHHVDQEYVNDFWEQACQFRLWQQANQDRVKIPD